MLEAAKKPRLKMKLLNMPISLDPDRGDIERCMKDALEAAFTRDLTNWDHRSLALAGGAIGRLAH